MTGAVMKALRTILLFLSLLPGLSCRPSEEPFDLMIVNGRVVDGTGNPWFVADIGIRGERIAAIGKLGSHDAKEVIDARGKVVAPGFIDMLGQSSENLLIDHRAISKISQGITTEITGEGSSIAPVNQRILDEWKPFLDQYHLTVDWQDFDGYYARLEKNRTAINLASFVGATQVRAYVVGYDNREPTPAELEAMKNLVRAAMRQGALGVSTSLIYPPASFAKTRELIELAKVASEYGGIYISHIRNEGNDKDRTEIQALYELADIARSGHIPAEIWHLKVAGKKNWGMMASVIKIIEQHRQEGLDLTADLYPYTASGNSLGASLPEWAHDGGTAKLLQRLSGKETRQKIKDELLDRVREGDLNPETIMISTVANPSLKDLEGRLLIEIAAARKQDPVETMLDIVLADSSRTGKITFSMNEADMRMAMAQPWVGFCTDAGARAPDGPLSEGKPHPRAYGSFARILGRYVREQKVLTLEDAIRKMTSLPANRVGLKERGLLKQGYFADVVVFDPATVSDRATFQDPHQCSVGIDAVLVNGQVVWMGGKFTGNLPGKALRGPGYAGR
jgi:N-acyl-D-amino-acid deacylase